MPIRVDTQRCRQNHRCPAVDICPEEALRQKGYRAPAIDREKCAVCLECTFFCPNGVFTYREETANEGEEQEMSKQENTFTIGIEGMSCQHCVKRVTDEIAAIEGVKDVDVSLIERSATVTADDIYRDEVVAAIERAGYRTRL